MYTIRSVPSKHRFELVFDNYQDHDHERFVEDIEKSVLKVRDRQGRFDMLADFTSSIVMPQDIAEGSRDLVVWLIANGLRKSANVLQSATQQMQIQRVTEQDSKFAYFDTFEEAEEWLAKE